MHFPFSPMRTTFNLTDSNETTKIQKGWRVQPLALKILVVWQQNASDCTNGVANSANK
jgi:hypothetical protein